MLSVTLLSVVRADNSAYVGEFVVSANSSKIKYANGKLDLFPTAPLGMVIATAILAAGGAGVAAIGVNEMSRDSEAALGCMLLGGLIGLPSLAYLGYVFYQVNKDTPYVSLDSTCLTVSDQRFAWRDIASIRQGEIVTHTHHNQHIAFGMSVGSSTRHVTSTLSFFNKFDTPLVTIIDDGWLPVSIENLKCLAESYWQNA